MCVCAFLTDPTGITISGNCHGTYSATNNEVTSPNYPNKYGSGTNCYWNIQSDFGTRIALQFTAFNVEAHSTCSYDWVQVYDGSSSSATALSSKLCSSTLPVVILSSQNSMYLIFRTDGSGEYNGFRAIATATSKYYSTNTRSGTGPNGFIPIFN